MSIFADPGNILIMVLIGIIGYFIWKQGRKAQDSTPVHGEIIPVPTNWELYYNNKYPMTDILYDGRKVPWREGRYNIDVRDFFHRYDSQVKRIVQNLDYTRAADDTLDNQKAWACLNWIRLNVRYAADVNADGSQTDYWNFPFETLLPRSFDNPQLFGDCEDTAILLANMMLVSGIEYWKIRLTAADVDDGQGNKGGHVFVTFFDEPRERWVLLDTSFLPNLLPIMVRPNYMDNPFVKEIWFSWSERYGFAADVNKITNMKGARV